MPVAAFYQEEVERTCPQGQRSTSMSDESSGDTELNSSSIEPSHDGRFKALIEHSLDVIALVGPDATVEYVSPSIRRTLGYAPNEFIGRNGFELIHPDDVEDLRRRFEEVLKEPGASQGLEARYRHKGGSW